MYILYLSANFSVITGPIFVKLIAFSLASINLGRGERIIKIVLSRFIVIPEMRNLFHCLKSILAVSINKIVS